MIKMLNKKEKIKLAIINFLKALEIKLKQRELNKISDKIKDLKELAIKNQIHEKAEKIARILGKWSDWWGGLYNFHGEGLFIQYHNNGIEIKFNGKEVFSSSKKYSNKQVEIHKFIQNGNWEEILNDLMFKIPIEEKKKNLEKLIEDINYQKAKFSI